MTPLDFVIIALSALTLHRVWNYENIMADPRQWIDKLPYVRKPALCPACNAFWLGLAAVLLWVYAPFPVSATLAAYMPARILVWVYVRMATPPAVLPSQAPVTPEKARGLTSTSVSSDEVAKVAEEAKKPTTQRSLCERTVIIMTALADFRPSYSVASAVADQATAIAMAHPTWEVQIWVMKGADTSTVVSFPPNVAVYPVIPIMPWIENITSKEKSEELRDALLALLAPFRGTTIITHDLLFVTWYTLFAHAIHLIGATHGHHWFHIPHSLPSGREGKSQYITTMPAGNHHVVTVARGFEQPFADYYQIPRERVHRIPNIRDPRTWGTMTPRVRHIITQTRLWERDWVQIFPVCTTRLEAKGFSKVARTFAMLNDDGYNSFLLICNPNAGGEGGARIMAEAKKKAESLGLSPDRLAFVSDLAPDSIPYGLSADEMKTLMYGYGNVLLFPSMSEADSLILREAQLAGQVIVGNDDVSTLNAIEDADIHVHWGVSDKVEDLTCRFVANRLLVGPRDIPRRRVLKSRNLEGIGYQWGKLITASGPSSG